MRGLTQPLPGHLFLGDGRRAAASVDKLSITVAARRRLHTNCFPLFSTSPILSSPSRRQTRLLYIRFRVALLDIRIAVGATGLLSTTQTASFYKCEHLHRKGFIHSEEDDPIQKREQLAQSELQNLERVSPCAALNGRPFQFQSRVRKCWCLRTWVRPRSSHGDPHFAFDMCAPLMTLPAGHATRKEV